MSGHWDARVQRLALVTLVVDAYDRAIAYYCDVLGFELVEDTPLSPEKRWVVVRPSAGDETGDIGGCGLLLARGAKPEQTARIGDQTGGRVGFFLHTDDFDRDFARYTARGVNFVNGPRDEVYGRVGVFEDLYGNLWDLVGPKPT